MTGKDEGDETGPHDTTDLAPTPTPHVPGTIRDEETESKSPCQVVLRSHY